MKSAMQFRSLDQGALMWALQGICALHPRQCRQQAAGQHLQHVANTLEQTMNLLVLAIGAYTVMHSAQFTIGMLVAFQMFSARLSQPMLRLVGLVFISARTPAITPAAQVGAAALTAATTVRQPA